MTIIDDKAPPPSKPAVTPATTPSDSSRNETPPARERSIGATPTGPVTDYADTQSASDAAEVERVVESLGAKANETDAAQDSSTVPTTAGSAGDADPAPGVASTQGAAPAASATPTDAAPSSASATSVSATSVSATGAPATSAPVTGTPAAPAAALPDGAAATPSAGQPVVAPLPSFSDSGPLVPDDNLPVASPTPLVETSDAGLAQSDAAPPSRPDAAEPSEPQAPPLPAYLHRGDNGWSVLKRIVRAKTRFLTDRLSRHITDRTLRIGISARIFHPQPGGKGLQSKTLQYLEESIAHWVMTRNALVFMVPTVNQDGAIHPSDIRMRDYALTLDGLVLQGGADVSPMSYSQSATRPEWNGDRIRDRYELELLQAFIDAGKPVLGICRGCQLINVAFGGTLHQDIATELPESIAHVNDHYDANWHEVKFPEGSTLPALFDGQQGGMVNSIHHQSVSRLGRDLTIEAVSPDDNVVEAIRLRRAPFVVGLQWHPEFHSADTTSSLLNCTPILDQFLRAARETRF